MASKPTPPGGTPARPGSGKVPIGVTRPMSGAKSGTADLPKSGSSEPAKAGPTLPPRPVRAPQPKTKLTPWPPSGSPRKSTRRRRTGLRWALTGLGVLALSILGYLQFGPRAQPPVLVVLGGGVGEEDGRLIVTAGSVDRIGALGQVQAAIPVANGRLVLTPKLLEDLLGDGSTPVWLRATRADTGGRARTLITVVPPGLAPPEDSPLLAAGDLAAARTLPPARGVEFSIAELGQFEVTPAGAGPAFLDGVCKESEPVPPGEWFLLYRAGASEAPRQEINSVTACIDVCREPSDACTDCRLEEANRRSVERLARDQQLKGRLEEVQSLTQQLAIRSQATRHRLVMVDERCYGLIPRHNATLMGAFIVPVEPRPLELETPVGNFPLR